MPLPSISLQYDVAGQNLVTFECDVARISAETSFAGGVLRIPFQQVGQGYDGSTIVLLYGRLSLFASETGLTIPAQPHIRNRTYLEVPIADEQIARLEAERAGRLLEVRLSVHGLAHYHNAVVAVTSSYAPTLLVHETWLTVLDQLGYGRRRIVELPALPASVGGKWTDAAARLDAAAKRLAAGDVGVAIGEIRIGLERTVEAIGELLGRPKADKEPVRNFFEAVAADAASRHVPRSDDPFEAIACAIRLAYATFQSSSDPQHVAMNAGERANAEFAYTIATGLYVYGVRLRALAPPLPPPAQ